MENMEDISHLWPHNCSWHFISDMCTKCQPSSMIRSVSRTPCHWWVYLEDIEGSRQKTLRTGSSLTSWIYLVDPYDPIQKISGQYLYFGQFISICHVCHKTWQTLRHYSNNSNNFWLQNYSSPLCPAHTLYPNSYLTPSNFIKQITIKIASKKFNSI